MNEPNINSVLIATELRGGVGVYALNLINGLTAAGISVTVATPQPEASPVPNTITVTEVSGRGRYFRQAREFSRALRDVPGEIDLVHFTDARYSRLTHVPTAPTIGTMNDYFYALSSLHSTEYVRNIYEDWIARFAYYNALRLSERPALRNLDGIICIANEVKSILHSAYDIAQEKMTVVPYGINFLKGKHIPLEQRDPIIFFAGGNFQRKGLKVLIEAAPAILQVVPGIQFVIAGDSRDERIMKELVNSRDLTDSFEFLGQISYQTLYEYYRRSAAFAMPSLLEAFGIPYLEAMYCGTPVVASDCPGPTDYLRDGWNCLMPHVGDANALADALISAVADDSLRRRLTSNGESTAKTFTVERMISSTLDSYSLFLRQWRETRS